MLSMDETKGKSGIGRREFLLSTAAAGAGLMLAPGLRAQGASAGSNDLNVGIIGTGAQGQVLIDACLQIPNVRFKAVCDIWTNFNQLRTSRLLKKFGHEHNVYVDYQELIDKEKGKLDAVIVATPDFWHAEHAVACFKAGFNVYCEKEMSNTLEGARKMVKAALETGKLLQIGHQRRSNPRYLHSYEKLIKEAKLMGRITTINGQWNRAAKDFRVVPEKYNMSAEVLQKYGFKSMEQFLNWRWFKGLGGGAIVDLGSHQIDIFSWFLETPPRSVIASGGTDYYGKDHEWYDTVMAVYEYDTPKGTVRASYQTLTTNGFGGYYEVFMGDQGTLQISESAGMGRVYRDEANAPDWDQWVKKGFLSEPVQEQKPQQGDAVLDVRESAGPPSYYGIPTKMVKKYHQPHLENFFESVQGKAKLNCPAEIGYETAVTVLKVNEAVEACKRLEFKPEDFKV
jgi:predicted dehydrogenase